MNIDIKQLSDKYTKKIQEAILARGEFYKNPTEVNDLYLNYKLGEAVAIGELLGVDGLLTQDKIYGVTLEVSK